MAEATTSSMTISNSNQIRLHEEELSWASRALSNIHSVVYDAIFTRIVTCETANEAWNKLNEKFQGSERSKHIHVLNLRRD